MKSYNNYKGAGLKKEYDSQSFGKIPSYNAPGMDYLKEYGQYNYASNEFLNGFLGATQVMKNKISDGITGVKNMEVNI